jgi:hypothetical protein
MTNYINQEIARQQLADLIAAAERGRVRRQFRQARRAARAAQREARPARRGPSNAALSLPGRIGLLGVR